VPSGFSHKYNTDDVLLRSVIVGLINSLNEQIYFNNIISDNETQLVRVPFYYAFSGDERFLQDYFSNWSDCAPNFVEGNYDPIPRGSLTLTGINILNTQQTSRFVRGFYLKEENGELLRYNSYLNSIPASLTFDVKILVDTVIDAFKINQEIIRVFYKTLVFRSNYAGVVVPSQAGFPENYNLEKQFEYSYGETNRITVSFTLEVETYFPIFDPKQEMFGGNRIEYFGTHVGPTAFGATGSTAYDQARGVLNPQIPTPRDSPGFIKKKPDYDKYGPDTWIP